MFQPDQLIWDDIKSELFEGFEYINHIQSKRERIVHHSNYKAYKLNESLINELKTFFENSSQTLKILTLGATWCQTCADVKPSLIKIVEAVDSKNLKIFLLDGVKTTMQSTEEDYTWAQKSPPEFHNPKFAVNQIPLVYFFDNSGTCFTRIEKYPKNGLSFEEAILEIAHKYLS
ncbi:MAG: thioredoxin family protein [Promethearchaeati archaeon]